MPKLTFHNLPDSKRKHFIQEAYKEFSLHSYESGSITNLVKKLGIAKGSVYQYFEDKGDLFHYLINEANLQLNRLLDTACPYQNEPFFEWYLKLIMVEVKFYLSFPQYAVLFNQLIAATDNECKEIRSDIINDWESRIVVNAPYKVADSSISVNLLVLSPFLIFNLITNELNLESIIKSGDPVYLESRELVTLCSNWVKKLEQGII